ncbi:MAG: WecB/TagA/CpsF family glycosyltransferase [Pirellulales bacterium]|nr:WecB/TagA/CpsF family glycosyltransferase [Pirellulales bacterium]
MSCIELFGIRLNCVSLSEASHTLVVWMREDRPCRYVVTLNVDHVVKLQSQTAFQAAYASASLVVADGWPLVTASRWLGKPLPERVAGSDLVPGLLSVAGDLGEMRVFLLGGAPGVAEQAVIRIHERWPNVRVVGTASPRVELERDGADTDAAVEAINAVQPHLLVVGLGAPKQEQWLHRNAPRLQAKVAIAAGATIDFLAGVQTRAPRWIRRMRMEWLYRLASNPRRLAGRYFHDAFVFPRLVVAEWWRARKR